MAPTVFSAGSFSARIWPESADIARNEFYIVDLHVPTIAGASTSSRGKIRTWQWSYGNGWIFPRTRSGLGPTAAFGTRTDIGDLASETAGYLIKSFAGKTVEWQEVIEQGPAIDYLIPEDLDYFTQLLTSIYNIKIVTSFDTGLIAELQIP